MSTALLNTMAKLETAFSRFQLLRAQNSEATLLKAKVERRAIRAASLLRSAFSAESIVTRMLSSRGWTKRWRKGELSGKQHLSLLEDCRQFGRARLRHEAETLFDQHGVEIEESYGRRVDVAGSRSIFGGDQGRALQIPGQILDASDGNSVSRGITSRATGAINRFFRRSKQFIHELITAGAMLLKGDEPLTHDELLAVDRQAKRQAEYMDRFEREARANPPREISDLSSHIVDVMPDTMSSNQFIARAESYGNAVWQVQNVGRAEVTRQKVFEGERRVHFLSMEEHRPCRGGEQGCLEQSQLGWQPLGTLRDIGDCFCMGSCDCYFEWITADKKIHVSPWGRHNPKGYNQPGAPGTELPGFAFPPDVKGKTDQPPPTMPQPKKLDLPSKAPSKPRKATPLPSVEELIEEAGSPFPASEYEEA